MTEDRRHWQKRTSFTQNPKTCVALSRCTWLYLWGMQRAKQYCTHQSTPHEERQLSKRNLDGTRRVHVYKRERELTFNPAPGACGFSQMPRGHMVLGWQKATGAEGDEFPLLSLCTPPPNPPPLFFTPRWVRVISSPLQTQQWPPAVPETPPTDSERGSRDEETETRKKIRINCTEREQIYDRQRETHTNTPTHREKDAYIHTRWFCYHCEDLPQT